MLRISEKDGGVLVDIAVKPRSSREGVGPVQADRLVVSVNAPPVDGKANEHPFFLSRNVRLNFCRATPRASNASNFTASRQRPPPP